MVESVFFVSMVSIIWLINYYFFIGFLLRILFFIFLVLVYLCWRLLVVIKGMIVVGLLFFVLMGFIWSVVFVIFYGFMSL